ncbi:MAG: hypothetical protein WDM90_07190 [Ferruginibacter sp.]
MLRKDKNAKVREKAQLDKIEKTTREERNRFIRIIDQQTADFIKREE